MTQLTPRATPADRSCRLRRGGHRRARPPHSPPRQAKRSTAISNKHNIHPRETNTCATEAKSMCVATRHAQLALPCARSARIGNLAAQHVPLRQAAADPLTTPRFAQNSRNPAQRCGCGWM
ncbi:hypothetical protein N9L68_01470 [bacterium]|nr:hypothetical protein [bacterium]